MNLGPRKVHSLLVFFSLLVQSLLLRGVVSQADNSKGVEEEEESPPCYPPPVIIPPTVTTHSPKIVIAHRGASAHLPEHSLPAYRLALELDADYIEPDLVATKDNELIAVHSMDMEITTDVAEKFPDRKVFSKYLNQTGYWSYEFTLEEVKTLRVHQRLPTARSTVFDGLFEVPTLTEIMQLIQQWNNIISPQLINSTSLKAEKGIYAELKDYPWLLEDTGTDLVELLFHHMEDNKELWNSVVMENLCDTKRIYDYRLPPFILQSFEIKALISFTEQWEITFNANSTDVNRPAPPAILLVPREKCLDDNFWFQVDDTWRQVLSGIGPDKDCLYQHWREFMERAAKLNLAVHPWTERPELEYIGGDTTTPTFETVLDEIVYFFCVVGVHGIFSESVEMAVLAANMPCPDKANHPAGNLPEGEDSNRDSGNSPCYETDQESNLYLGLASFTSGVFLSVLVGLFVTKRHQRRGIRQMRIPTVETTNDDEVNDDDMEML